MSKDFICREISDEEKKNRKVVFRALRRSEIIQRLSALVFEEADLRKELMAIDAEINAENEQARVVKVVVDKNLRGW